MSTPAALRWAMHRRSAMQRYTQSWQNASSSTLLPAQRRSYASSSSSRRSAEKPTKSQLTSSSSSRSISASTKSDDSAVASRSNEEKKKNIIHKGSSAEVNAGIASPAGATGGANTDAEASGPTLAAVRAYQASSRGKPASPPPAIKLTDHRTSPPPTPPSPSSQASTSTSSSSSSSSSASTSTPEQQQQQQRAGTDAPSVGGVLDAVQDVDGSAQKMLRAGASKHPAAREQERQQAQELNAQSQQQAQSQEQHAQQQQQQQQQSLSQDQAPKQSEARETVEGETRRREHSRQQPSTQPSTITREGVVISAPAPFSNTGEGGQRGFPQMRGESSRGRTDGTDTSNASTSSGASSSSGDGGSQPPTTTPATTAEGGQISDLGRTRPPRIDYPFNTHAFVKRLLEAGFIKAAQEDSEKAAELTTTRRHDPSESIMELTRNLLVDRGEHVVQHHMNKTEAENQAYLYTAALSELRTEVQVRARNDAAALRSNVTILQREVDGLSQKMREDVAAMKHDIQVDMNNRKGEAKEEQNTLEQEIQDLNNRFTISISDLKTEIEQNIKWDATRRALTVVFGSVVILIGTLAAADYFGKPDEPPNAIQRPEIKEVAPRSAEELGLVPNYDEKEDGSRYV